MHKDILAAPILGDKAKPLHRVVPLDRAGLLDGGLVGRRIHRSLRSCTSERLLLCGAAVDAQDFGYLWPFGTGPARTSSVAPSGTLSWPLRSTTLTCRKASPDPSASCT